MVALTCDFHVVASRHATRFSAVFVSISYIAQAWDVGALFRLLIRHFIPSFPVAPTFPFTQAQRTLWRSAVSCSTRGDEGPTQGGQVSATTSFPIMHADFQTSRRRKLLLSKVVVECCEGTLLFRRVDRLIALSVFGPPLRYDVFRSNAYEHVR